VLLSLKGTHGGEAFACEPDVSFSQRNKNKKRGKRTPGEERLSHLISSLPSSINEGKERRKKSTPFRPAK
jgi:hypothetical protein